MAIASDETTGAGAGSGLTLNGSALDNDLITGKAGGQEIKFDTASGAATGKVTSTSHATKGKWYLNDAATIVVDEANVRFGVGQATPGGVLHTAKSAPSTPTVFGDLLASATGLGHQVEIGNTGGTCGLRVGQASTNNLGFNWQYNATPANAYGELNTYGYTNPIRIDSALTCIGATAGNLHVGTVTQQNTKFFVLGRSVVSKGADIAAAGTLTLGVDGSSFGITGTATINYITTTNWPAGSEITLRFAAAATVNHNTGSVPGGTAAVLLSGAANITFAANTVLKLYYDGTNWIDVRKIA